MAVKGLDRLKRQLKALPQLQREAVREVLEKSAREMRDAMRQFAPVKLGKLYRSIDYRQGPPPGTSATGAFRMTTPRVGAGGASASVKGEAGLLFTVWAGDDNAYYARWVEFGTQPHSLAKGADISRRKRQDGDMHPGSEAQPFFYPVVRAHGRRIKSRVARAANKAAKAVAGVS